MTDNPTGTALSHRLPIVFGACLTQFTVIGLLFSYGIFFKELEAEFGWSRALLSGCTSFAFLAMGLMAFFCGRLSDRYGPRLVLAGAGTLCGLGYLLISQASQPWHLFVIFGLLIGSGLATHDVVTLSTIARWFRNRRGIMTGVVKVGTATGQIAVPPIAAALIAWSDWRTALIVLGGSAIFILLFAAFLVRGQPQSVAAGNNQSTATGLSIEEARRSKVLWMVCAIQFSFFPTLTTVPLHIAVHGMDIGMVATTAAFLLSTLGAASIVGRLTIGFLVDRIGGRRGLIACYIPLIASLLCFLAIEEPMLLFAAVALYGFGHGGFFTIMSPVVAEFFGLKSHGAIFGIVIFFGTIGGSIGPFLAGWTFDLTQTYSWTFIGLAGLAATGLLLAIQLPRSSLAQSD